MTSLARLSIIVPVVDRETDLARTLSQLPPTGEVIVVDGGSADASADIAEASGATVLRTGRGRAQQMRSGAQCAAGPWLLFLHADTRLNEAAWRAVDEYIGDAGSAGRAAALRFALDDRGWQARVLEAAVQVRVALFALPYGDQGLLIHRSLYEAVGGFADVPIMEDVDLVRRLGRRRLTQLAGTATTSAERWRQRGWVRQSALNLFCLARFLLGASPQSIARLYSR